MATVNKDFKIKSGLVVEGTTGTIGGHDILTKKQADQDYIVSLIGGTATPDNTPDTVVKRDGSGNFAAQTVTVEVLNVSGIGTISDDDELLIAASEGEDIKLTADDVRIEAVDDFRATVGGDIVLEAGEGNHVYAGFISAENVVVTEGSLDSHIGDNTVDGTAGNTVYDRIFNAKAEAISTANSDTDTKLADYTTTANLDTTVDGYGYLKSADLTGYATETYADNAAGTAETNAKAYADSLIDDASNLSTEVWSAYKTNTEIGLAEDRAKQHADDEIAALVGSAPALLDTLQELAAAIDNDPETINNLQSLAAGKQNSLTEGANIDITNDVISVTGLTSAEISDFNTAALSATASAYDVAGSAALAQAAAENYADGLATNYDAAGSAAAAENNAIVHANSLDSATNARIDSLDTGDVAEGSNLYYTTSRAKSDAAALLTGANLTNIQITGDGNGLSITAENGVADSTTDDLAEGSTNKYFADQLALDAMSNATSVEVQKLDISWVRREEAAYASVATASTATVHSFGTNEGSVKYLVRVYNNNKSHVTEVLATTDSDNNVAVVEYGTIYTSENPLATVTVVWNASSSQYDLNVTTANNNSEVLVAATLLAYND